PPRACSAGIQKAFICPGAARGVIQTGALRRCRQFLRRREASRYDVRSAFWLALRLGVPDARMLRLKEPWEKRVDAQQTCPCQRDDVAARLGEISLFIERSDR